MVADLMRMYLKGKEGKSPLTVIVPDPVEVNYRQSAVKLGEQQYRVSPIGHVAQELILAGGLDQWIQKQRK